MQSYEKMIIFSIFTRSGSLPQIFGQVKELLKLGLHEMIRVSHIVS